jgi:hypothetical protein
MKPKVRWEKDDMVSQLSLLRYHYFVPRP